MPDQLLVDYFFECNTRGAVLKAVKALGNILGYELCDPDTYELRSGVNISINVPQGANTAAIPPGYVLLPAFVSKPPVVDAKGEVTTPAVVSSNWFLNMRLAPPASTSDRLANSRDEVADSKIKSWLLGNAPKLKRASRDDRFTKEVDYYQYDLKGGSWIRLYTHLDHPKHTFTGGVRL